MLSIQKHILLLNTFHFNEFSSHLKLTKAELSYRLVNEIRDFGWEQPDSDKLCERIYGDSTEKSKKKFLQLTHHTLKLSSFLSRNYPSYLKHNLSLIEENINKGHIKKANLVADYLLDISEKVEDNTTCINVLKFMSQQAFLIEEKDSVKCHKQIAELVEREKQLNDLYCYIREHLHYKRKENVTTNHAKTIQKNFFDPYINSPSFSVSILARFGKYYELSFLYHQDFYKNETLIELDKIERDLKNNSYIIFPFLDDVLFKILGLKLQYMVHRMDSSGMMKESQRIIEESSHLKFWQSYVNVPELFAIAIQASHYVSHYGETYREDHYRKLPDDVKKNIDYLKEKIVEELEKPIWNEGYLIKLINTRSLYSGLLLLGSTEEIKKGINLIEETLITYQQIPFQKFLDGMFAGLVIGYFSLKNYEKVAECYKRYKKSTSGNIVNEENDLTIAAYYYTSQWLITKRKQYVEKLINTHDLAQSKPNLKQVGLLVKNVAAYFDINISK